MAYERSTDVPRVQIPYDVMRFFNFLPNDEKGIVWEAVMDYFDKARMRGAEIDLPDAPSELSAMSKSCFSSLIEAICKSVENYWKTCEKNARNAPHGNGQPVVNQPSTSGQPINESINEQTNKKINKPPNEPQREKKDVLNGGDIICGTGGNIEERGYRGEEKKGNPTSITNVRCNVTDVDYEELTDFQRVCDCAKENRIPLTNAVKSFLNGALNLNTAEELCDRINDDGKYRAELQFMGIQSQKNNDHQFSL